MIGWALIRRPVRAIRFGCLTCVILASAGCIALKSPFKKVAWWEVRGQITAVASDSISVRHKSGRTFAIPISSQTRFLHEGLTVSATGLRKNRRVQVRAQGLGVPAVEITIFGESVP